jgi:hypothetical protein
VKPASPYVLALFYSLEASRSGRPSALATEAIAAVDRTVAPRTKRDCSVYSALGADDREHLTRAAVETVAAAAKAVCASAVASLLTARMASLGLILIAFFSMVLLIVGAEYEALATFHASKGLVHVVHR